MNELEINNSVFENIKHIDETGKEYWLARELQIALDYNEWRKFN
jgi:DNA-damage-inducible protein D